MKTSNLVKNLALSFALFLSIPFSQFNLASAIETGKDVSNIEALNQNKKLQKISDYKGKPVLLYFYPKDETSGCTKEACSIRDQWSKYQKAGAVVIGVSRQDAKSHQEFIKKHKLPFDLWIDEDGSIAEKLGIETMAVVGLHKRQSLLIDRDGKVAKVYKDVDPETHSAQVLADIEKLH